MQQLRDNRGRFVKEPEIKRNLGTFTFPVPESYNITLVDEDELKIAWSVRAAIWLSLNKKTILFYILYVGICLLAGGIGGYFGVKLALR